MSLLLQFLCLPLALLLSAWPSAAQVQEGRQALLQQARLWVASTQGVLADRVQFAPLDDRLVIRPCNAPVQFDLPFASKETVRARCMSGAGQTQWQIYLRQVEGMPRKPESLTEPPRPPASSAEIIKKVLFSKTMIPRGTLLSADQFEERDVSGPGHAMAIAAGELHSMEMLRDLPAGSILQGYDVRKAVLVRQGQLAVLTLGAGSGFMITVKVEALQDGRLGEQIRLKNPESGKTLSGVVTGLGALRGL